MVFKMAIQQYPDTQNKSFLSYKGKTFSSQKDLSNFFELKPKQFKELLGSKEISLTSKNFLFHQMTNLEYHLRKTLYMSIYDLR